MPIPDGDKLPLFRSHKQVGAVQIATVTEHADGSVTLGFQSPIGGDTVPQYSVLSLIPADLLNKPKPQAGMYLIVYQDGYFSFHPGEGFEKDYAPLADEPPVPNQHRKIKGYRDLSPEDIARMNMVKECGVMLGDLVKALEGLPEADKRWLAIGRTHLQEGLMALTRSIAKPDFF